MRKIATAAAALLVWLAAPALAQQANPGKVSPGERSNPGTITGPLGSKPNAQPGSGNRGRITDCPPDNTSPECQQAMVPGSRGENPTPDSGATGGASAAKTGRPNPGEAPTGPLNGSVDQTQTGSR